MGEPDGNLPDPKCQGSSLRYNSSGPECMVFLNPAHTQTRRSMKARISQDCGVTWSHSKDICDYAHQGGGGYSSMAMTADAHVVALVERNEYFTSSEEHRSIDLHKFNLKWIATGAACNQASASAGIFPSLRSAAPLAVGTIGNAAF